MKKLSALHKDNFGYLFITPFILAFIAMQLLPMVYTFIFSLCKWDGFTEKIFIGVDNYVRLVSDKMFWKAIYNTFFMWVINVFPRMALALLCAVLITRKSTKYKGLFRAVFYFPNLVTTTAVAALFTFMFGYQNSTVNLLLLHMGIISEPIPFLKNPLLAQSLSGFVTLWMWFGYATVFFVSSIMGIPEELYEAATVDGANSWKRFTSVTFPSLKPAFSFVFISALIGGLQAFDIPMLVSNGTGNPERSLFTMTMYMYTQAFETRQIGYGSAIAYGLFIIIMIFSILSFRIINRKETEY